MSTKAPAYYPYRTPHGFVTIRAEDDCVTDVTFGDITLSGKRNPSALTNRAATELLEYFAGKRRVFDLPLAPKGSEFQRAVWQALAQVPYGESLTNANIAEVLGNPRAYRSVGSAVHKNALAILIPDHRVVGAAGNLLGVGSEARLRHALLEFEREQLMHA